MNSLQDVPEALVQYAWKFWIKSNIIRLTMHLSCLPSLFLKTSEQKKDIVPKYTEKDLFDEFTQDENGNVVLSEEEADKPRSKRLGGYEKLYRIKLEGDYLAKLAFDGAEKNIWRPFVGRSERTAQLRVVHHENDGFPGILLDCAGLYQCRPHATGRFGRPGTWFGCRFGGGLLPGHHENRPYSIRPCCSSVS